MVVPSPRFGSSPRVRGTHRHRLHFPSPLRFIPACAGNALLPGRRAGLEPVHPRVCGERFDRRLYSYHLYGSSPRVRGTRAGACPIAWLRRFIPACAGNAASSRQWAAVAPVHPRVCGERIERAQLVNSYAGSSPRVRGTRFMPGKRDLSNWFIPACAGNASLV